MSLSGNVVLPSTRNSHTSKLSAAAAEEAIKQSGLTISSLKPQRIGVVVGSALGGQSTTEIGFRDHYLRQVKATHPLVLVRSLASSAAAHLGIEYYLED